MRAQATKTLVHQKRNFESNALINWEPVKALTYCCDVSKLIGFSDEAGDSSLVYNSTANHQQQSRRLHKMHEPTSEASP